MGKSRFTEEQIIGMVKEQEAERVPSAALVRRASTNIKPADSRYDRGISGGQVIAVRH